MGTKLIVTDVAWQSLPKIAERCGYDSVTQTGQNLNEHIQTIAEKGGVFVYVARDQDPDHTTAAAGVYKQDSGVVLVPFYFVSPGQRSVLRPLLTNLFSGILKSGLMYSYNSVLIPCSHGLGYGQHHGLLAGYSETIIEDKFGFPVTWYSIIKPELENMCTEKK